MIYVSGRVTDAQSSVIISVGFDYGILVSETTTIVRDIVFVKAKIVNWYGALGCLRYIPQFSCDIY